MEIKVRAISKRDIELGTPLMFYTKLIDGEPYFVHEDIRYPYSGVMFDDDFIKMLWTGLKDKNGKEIWEGDILKGHATGITYAVFFENGSYFARSGSIVLSRTDFRNNEVIGNIYEGGE